MAGVFAVVSNNFMTKSHDVVESKEADAEETEDESTRQRRGSNCRGKKETSDFPPNACVHGEIEEVWRELHSKMIVFPHVEEMIWLAEDEEISA